MFEKNVINMLWSEINNHLVYNYIFEHVEGDVHKELLNIHNEDCLCDVNSITQNEECMNVISNKNDPNQLKKCNDEMSRI